MINPMDPVARAGIIQSALSDRLRSKLREYFMEQAKPVIEDMVNEAMKDLKVGIEEMLSPMDMARTVHVILEDRRENRK